MGILFQNTCFQVPDAEASQAEEAGADIGTTARELTSRRRQQLGAIVEEARAWMYALLIPTEIIANGDQDIKANLDEEIEFLTTTLLGTKIDRNKVNLVCAKIARHILAPGIGNLDPGQAYPFVPSYDQVRHLLDARFIKAGFLQIIHDNCALFSYYYPKLRTWHEIRQVANQFALGSEPLSHVLERWQEAMTWSELGVPFFVEWRVAAETNVYNRLRSSNPARLDNFTPAQRDLILVRSGSRPGMPGWYAEIDRNIMTLHPRFFGAEIPNGLQQLQLRLGENILHHIRTRVLMLLHEITHSADVLNTDDHKFKVSGMLIDYVPTELLVGVPSEPGMYQAYGLEACIALARRDKIYNLNKAEDNADSWAYYFTLRILLLAYPELAIGEVMTTYNQWFPQTRKLLGRVQLLHHCSLLFPLRHWDVDDLEYPLRYASVHDMFDPKTIIYDPLKDYYSVESGRKPPTTVKEILELAQAFDVERQRQEADQGNAN